MVMGLVMVMGLGMVMVFVCGLYIVKRCQAVM